MNENRWMKTNAKSFSEFAQCVNFRLAKQSTNASPSIISSSCVMEMILSFELFGYFFSIRGEELLLQLPPYFFSVYPFGSQRRVYTTYVQNFVFKLRRDHRKFRMSAAYMSR